jgi:rubredoxin
VLPQALTATLSDDSSVMLVGKYSNGPVKLFAGYEFIRYAPPSNPFAAGTGFSDISGDFVCAGCAAINTNINNTAFNAGDKPMSCLLSISPRCRPRSFIVLEDSNDYARCSRDTKFKSMVLREIRVADDTGIKRET